jgi:hypothetical protein
MLAFVLLYLLLGWSWQPLLHTGVISSDIYVNGNFGLHKLRCRSKLVTDTEPITSSRGLHVRPVNRPYPRSGVGDINVQYMNLGVDIHTR